MPTAELIAIGTELLLGEINDTNSKYIARQLREYGIDLFRTTMIGDNPVRITLMMEEALNRADIVITTGGLGPTVDDPTRDAAALAFNTELEFHPELWQNIQQRFSKRGLTATENNKKQAFVPKGSTIINNPVGTAPAFILSANSKTLICLPGVPREMEYLMQASVLPWLKEQYKLSQTIVARVLHVAGLGESVVDEKVSVFEKMENPTVGLLAYPGLVDIRITAKADSKENAEKMINDLQTKIDDVLGDYIYGIDNDTLNSSIQKIISHFSSPIRILTCGFSDTSFALLSSPGITIDSFSIWQKDSIQVEKIIDKFQEPIVFSLSYSNTEDAAMVEVGYVFQKNHFSDKQSYSSANELRLQWAENYCLNYIRRVLLSLNL